ncbi:hypothetical protein [Paraburkholderia sediminicola]|uniref:hypothetical protein n=1 Tax=Paraburkholderia sediminicola TaxID=458836 RepID=UPI0038B787B7
MRLQLGVLDQTYRTGESTGTVAKILEGRYGIMAIFAAQQSTQIANSLAVSLADATEAIMSGAPMANPYAEGTDQIQEAFRKFLDMNGTGIITQASKQGVSGRFKDKNNTEGKRGPMNDLGQVRPSFISTGLYQNSFRAWIEE